MGQQTIGAGQVSGHRIILVINCGSSSLKFSVFDSHTDEELANGIADRLNTLDATLAWSIVNKDKNSSTLEDNDHLGALNAVVSALKIAGLLDKGLLGIGHRVVHGGEFFNTSTLIDDDVLDKIAKCAHLAPLHNPANLTGIRTTAQLFPGIPQVAVFDTAFHQSIEKHVYLYALPYELYQDHGVRRYGFHGTSHAYVAGKAVEQLKLAPDNHGIICAHLGNGCSATAIKNGQSVDTTMGMTPLEGLCMGTRSGDIDPSIHQFLCKKLNLSIDEITNILNKNSGLLGLSQMSNDMRNLSEAAKAGHENAQLAIDVFCYRLAKAISALCVPLGRLDALVFTGGIGENAANIRAQVCEQLSFLGIELSQEDNAKHGKLTHGRIGNRQRLPVLVVQTQEEWFIANATKSIATRHLNIH